MTLLVLMTVFSCKMTRPAWAETSGAVKEVDNMETTLAGVVTGRLQGRFRTKRTVPESQGRFFWFGTVPIFSLHTGEFVLQFFI